MTRFASASLTAKARTPQSNFAVPFTGFDILNRPIVRGIAHTGSVRLRECWHTPGRDLTTADRDVTALGCRYVPRLIDHCDLLSGDLCGETIGPQKEHPTIGRLEEQASPVLDEHAGVEGVEMNVEIRKTGEGDRSLSRREIGAGLSKVPIRPAGGRRDDEGQGCASSKDSPQRPSRLLYQPRQNGSPPIDCPAAMRRRTPSGGFRRVKLPYTLCPVTDYTQFFVIGSGPC